MFFAEIAAERRQRYNEAGLIPRIQREPNGFLEDFKQRWAPDGNVTFLDPFQSGEDFRNDLQAILIKPLTCYFLSWYHRGRWLYELALAVVHLVTFDLEESGKHLYRCVTSVISIFVYAFLAIVELISQVLSFAMRCLMTIGHGLYQVGVLVGQREAAPDVRDVPNDNEDAVYEGGMGFAGGPA
jgi:hypothetical protein